MPPLTCPQLPSPTPIKQSKSEEPGAPTADEHTLMDDNRFIADIM